MSDVIHLKSRVEQLSKIHKCTKEKAVLTMIKNSEIQGSFTQEEICKVLGLQSSQAKLAYERAISKIQNILLKSKDSYGLRESLDYLDRSAKC